MTLSADDFELLLQANRILSSKLDVDDVLSAVMELATKVVRAEASSLLLLDEKNAELYFDVALGSVKERVKQIRIKVGEGIAGWVAQEQKPLIVNDVTKDSRFTGRVDKSTSFRTRSILAVPLRAKGKLIGVVEAINKENGQDFVLADQEAFGIFASQAAIAIQNARLFSELKREKEKLETVFSEMSDGVVYLDSDGKVLLVNDSASALLGINFNNVQGMVFCNDLIPHFEIVPFFKKITDIKESFSLFELVRREGKTLMLSMVGHRFETGFLLIITDVTEERREEHLKRNFISLISHKLKTPLTVIMGYIPLLDSNLESFSPIQKKAVQTIASQGSQLSGLVDKLLRFTLVESEQMKTNVEIVSVSSIIKQAMDVIKSILDENKMAIRLETHIDEAFRVQVDPALFIEVCKNIIENAIKFNDKPNKSLELLIDKHQNMVCFRFQDNGVGIPSEEIDKIFQKFYQIENDFTGQVPGAGLGLTFCRKVIEEFGGKITIQSELKKGTCVSVLLPEVCA